MLSEKMRLSSSAIALRRKLLNSPKLFALGNPFPGKSGSRDVDGMVFMGRRQQGSRVFIHPRNAA
jgi:hypothetical protein